LPPFPKGLAALAFVAAGTYGYQIGANIKTAFGFGYDMIQRQRSRDATAVGASSAESLLGGGFEFVFARSLV
jgi:hypothetical protein